MEQREHFNLADPLLIRLGLGLLSLGIPQQGGDLFEQITRIRSNVAQEIGIILPNIFVQETFYLDWNGYEICIDGQPVAKGTVYPDLYLALPLENSAIDIDGIKTSDPVYRLPAVWIEKTQWDQAVENGYIAVGSSAVIVTHLFDMTRRHAAEILTLDGTQKHLDIVRKTSPTLVDELVPDVLNLGQIHRILLLLLREQVSIRSLETILATLYEYGLQIQNPVQLTEMVRKRLSNTICSKYRQVDGSMHCLQIASDLETMISESIEYDEHGMILQLNVNDKDLIAEMISSKLDVFSESGSPPIVLVDPRIRAALKEVTRKKLPELVVLGRDEIMDVTNVKIKDLVTM